MIGCLTKSSRVGLCLYHQAALPKGFIILLLGIGGLLGCRPQQESPAKGWLVITKSIDGQEIGSLMQKNSHFQLDQLPQSGRRDYLRKTFEPNTTQNDLNLGASWNSQTGWAYIELINPTPKPLEIALTTSHIRCDALKAYGIESDSLLLIGEVTRTMPLVDRPYNTLEFALPIRVAPLDTLGVLLCSTRNSGFNILSPVLYEKAHFLNYLMTKRLVLSFKLSFLFVIILLIIAMGLLFKQPPLHYLSTYLVSILLLLLSSNYFFDLLPYFPSQAALGAHSVNVFSVFISNIFFFLFVYGFLGPYMKYPNRYITLAAGIVLINLALIGIMLLPQTIWTNQLFTHGFVVLIVANIIVLLVFSVLAYLRFRVLYLLVLSAVLFFPSLIGTFLNSNFVFFEGVLESVLVLFVIGYLVFRQFQEALISKRDSELHLIHQQAVMEEIRQEELEKLGRHLHDQVGNLLATAVGYLDLNSINKSKIRSLLTEAIQELRFTSHNLVNTKKKQPMKERIDQLVGRFNDYSKIAYFLDDYSASTLDNLSEQRQENIYLMIQEALYNIERHSNGKQANLQLMAENHTLLVCIEDDGVGIQSDEKSNGIGLYNLARRAELNQFKLTVDSSPSGTTIIIEIAL